MNIRRLALVGVAVAAVLALLWLVGGNAYARQRERQVEAEWIRCFGTLQQLVDRYAKTTTNDTARRLETLVKPLGLDLTPKDSEEMFPHEPFNSSPASQDNESWQAVLDYLTFQLQKPEAAIDPAPQTVSGFLTAHAADLSAVQEALLTLPPPAWSFDPASLPNHQSVPDSHALVRLQRVLLVETLVQSGSDKTAAARTLEASWRLNQRLREIPELKCQLIALAVARMEVGALRKVEVDENVWRARLTEHDFKQSVFDTQLLDLWPSAARYRQLEEIEDRSEKSAFKRLKNKLEKPYADIVWSDASEKMGSAYLRVKEAPVMDRRLWDAGVQPEKNASDILVSIAMPNLMDSFRRVDRLVIESELTDKILQARSLRRENNLRWPAAVAGIEATRFPGARWIYAVSPQGTMTLSLSEEPKWGASGLVLPCRFTSS
jgi:hypothetical protein